MATQLADRGPNPDLRSGKFGPLSTIRTNFGPLHFFEQEFTVCQIMHEVRAIPQIALKTFFFVVVQSDLGPQVR